MDGETRVADGITYTHRGLCNVNEFQVGDRIGSFDSSQHVITKSEPGPNPGMWLLHWTILNAEDKLWTGLLTVSDIRWEQEFTIEEEA